MGCNTSKSADKVGKSAAPANAKDAENNSNAEAEAKADVGAIAPVDNGDKDGNADPNDLERLTSSDGRSKKDSGSHKDGDGPVKSNTLVEHERRRLSVSTVSREQPEDAEARQTAISSTNFFDPALELVEQDRGIIREVTVSMIDQILHNTAERCLLFGNRAKENQKGFDNKNIATICPENKGQIGFACKKGHKPESPNQDDFFVLKVNDWSLYGVFDGHGPCGHDVSHFVHNALAFLLVGDQNFETDTLAIMKRAFRKVHYLLEAAAEQPRSRLDCTLSGTTGTIVAHRDKVLYVAHVGDSRAVLARRRADGKLAAINLTADHKPTREDERKRIESHGGEVRRLEGDIPHRVFVKNRMYPGLAMSRAIGDTIGSSVGVIPDPDTRTFELTDDDVFFTLCTDGVWEFVSSQEAIDLICRHHRTKVQDAAEALASESWNRWIEEEDNVVDDVTSIIVYL